MMRTTPVGTPDPLSSPIIKTIPLPHIPGVIDPPFPTNVCLSRDYPTPTSSVSSRLSHSPPISPPHCHLGLFTESPPPYSGGPVQIHPFLALTVRLEWDLACAPKQESIRVRAWNQGESSWIPSHILMEPATYPARLSITIISDTLPWEIVVTPLLSSYPRPNFVTLSDILTTLYTTLRVPVTSAEFASLSQSAQRRVGKAYMRRCSGVEYDERLKEKTKGVKRIDWFCGRTSFRGLGRMSGGGEEWVLRVG